MTKFIYLDGKIKWASGLGKIDEKYNTYNAQFYPTPEALAEFLALGTSVKIKEDDDGPNFKIKREAERAFKDPETGETEVKVMGPPRVFREDSDGQHDLDPATVGNGSDTTIKLAVYESKKYKTIGSRLEAVRVNNLVVYTPPAEDEMPF